MSKYIILFLVIIILCTIVLNPTLSGVDLGNKIIGEDSIVVNVLNKIKSVSGFVYYIKSSLVEFFNDIKNGWEKILEFFGIKKNPNNPHLPDAKPQDLLEKLPDNPKFGDTVSHIGLTFTYSLFEWNHNYDYLINSVSPVPDFAIGCWVVGTFDTTIEWVLVYTTYDDGRTGYAAYANFLVYIEYIAEQINLAPWLYFPDLVPDPDIDIKPPGWNPDIPPGGDIIL